MRIFFLGQKPIGERAFEYLRTRCDVVGACSNTRVDHTWWKTSAITHDVFVPNETRNDDVLLDAIVSSGADTLLSVQHPWIIPSYVLKTVNYNALNLHMAKLPRYRGHYCINHALLRRDEDYTTTIHWVADSVDEGAIAFEESVSISTDETARSLYKKVERASMDIFVHLVDRLVSGAPIPRIQQGTGGEFFDRRSLDSLKQIRDPDDVCLKARAFYFPPFEPAYFVINSKRYYVVPGERDDFI